MLRNGGNLPGFLLPVSIIAASHALASRADQTQRAMSNGQAEGRITKLKLIKRQMYGRGKLDLPQARVTGVAT